MLRELRRTDTRFQTIQGAGAAGAIAATEKAEKADGYAAPQQTRTLRSKVRALAQTAVRRAKSVAVGATVAGILVGTSLVTGCTTTAYAQRVTPATITAPVQAVQLTPAQQAERAAVMEVRQLHEQGRLEAYFERDARTGAYVHPEVMALFSRLPVIGPDVTPQDLLALGLIDQIPAGLDQLEQMPQYFEGKQVFVRTSTNSDRNGNNWNRYEAGGTERITHRGTLVGRAGDNFVVEVDRKGGGKERIEVTADHLFQLNQPSSPSGTKDNVNGIQIDYSDPIVRGKIAQGFAMVADDLAKLDFTKPANDRGNRAARLRVIHELFWNQKSEYVADHHKDWQRVGSAANILNEGVGVCTDQGTTQWAYAQVFERIAGFRILNVSGATIDLDRGHNFNIVWLKGSEEVFVTDRTWKSGNEHPTVDDAMGSAGWNRNRYVVGPNERTPADMVVPAHLISVRN